MNPAGHEHTGTWLTTVHSAPTPHVPGHGSIHLNLIQARGGAQSALFSHSLRQPAYGSPWNPGRHVQDPTPFLSWHSAFAPHGDGRHGSLCTGVRSEAVKKRKK